MELWWEAIMGCWGMEECLRWTGNPGTRLGVGRNQENSGRQGTGGRKYRYSLTTVAVWSGGHHHPFFAAAAKQSSPFSPRTTLMWWLKSQILEGGPWLAEIRSYCPAPALPRVKRVRVGCSPRLPEWEACSGMTSRANSLQNVVSSQGGALDTGQLNILRVHYTHLDAFIFLLPWRGPQPGPL